jgi:hypothetical protein
MSKQTESSHEFIPNIDDANIEVHRLETQLGLPKSEFIPGVEEAIDRVVFLNKQLAEYQYKAASNTTSEAANTNTAEALKVTGLERAIAASGGAKTELSGSETPLTGLARAIQANSASAENKADQASEAGKPAAELTGLQRAIAAASATK